MKKIFAELFDLLNLANYACVYSPEGVNIGLAVVQIQNEEDLGSALARADSALYKAKSSGRNCVSTAE